MREVQTAGRKRGSQQDDRDNDFLLHDRSLSQTKELLHGMVLPVAGETVGIVGTGELGTTMGGTLGAGTGAAALTPRLPIS
jgi:lactate dehydrogenase-like 2-hydroxyacid dehydrogenase